jgi:hypothetical protein
LAAAIVLVVLGMVQPVFAQSGTLVDCLSGCRPDDAGCVTCCEDVFSSKAEYAVLDAYSVCTDKCASLEGLKALMCRRACLDEARNALGLDAPAAEFDCPDWVEPTPCPDCQTWSLSRQKCVPAPRELCDQKE